MWRDVCQLAKPPTSKRSGAYVNASFFRKISFTFHHRPTYSMFVLNIVLSSCGIDENPKISNRNRMVAVVQIPSRKKPILFISLYLTFLYPIFCVFDPVSVVYWKIRLCYNSIRLLHIAAPIGMQNVTCGFVNSDTSKETHCLCKQTMFRWCIDVVLSPHYKGCDGSTLSNQDALSDFDASICFP